MKYCKKAFSSYDEQLLFVNACEREFEEKLSAAVEQVCNVEGIKVIGLSGPSCSGKTTTAKKLIDTLSKMGREVHLVSIDNFFKDKTKPSDDDESVDFDSINALDLEAFEKCINEIVNCEPTHIPHFDFITGKRTGYTEIQSDPTDLYIFEGIQAVYPEVTSMLQRFKSISIYIRANSAISLDGTVFEGNEIRLMRRIVRDYNFRGASADFTIYLWESVRRNEDKYIMPNADSCDYIIDSTLGYDINMLKPYLERILALPHSKRGNISEREYRSIADAILEEIEGVEPMSRKYLYENSLYREFI